MKTHLIFFGKSQDFTFLAFDRNGLISDFNSIIKDFDLLESIHFTTDDISNKEILAKYHFTAKSGVKYSLLKLYSLAQAVDGNRIAGSTFGVGLLSESDILFSEKNISLLKVAKENFAKLSLNGLKFNKSNFSNDAFKIWSAIVNSKEGNYLDSINLGSSLIFSSNPNPRAYYVDSLYEDSTDLESEMKNSRMIYVSNDIDHLKRANAKWGESFPLFVKSDAGWMKYQEPKKISVQTNIGKENIITQQKKQSSEKDSNDISKLKIQLSDLQYERETILREAKEKIAGLKRKNLFFIYANVFQVIIIIILFIILIKKKSDENVDDPTKSENGTAQVKFDDGSKPLKDPAVLLTDSSNYNNVREIVIAFEQFGLNSDSATKEKIKQILYIKYRRLEIDTAYVDKRIQFIEFNKNNAITNQNN